MRKKIIPVLSLAAVLAFSHAGSIYAAEDKENTTEVSEESDKEETKGIEKEAYYDIMRANMPSGSYGSGGYLAEDYWSCAGYAAHVIYISALDGAFGGYVPDYGNTATASAGGLEGFMRNDEHFELVRFFNDDCASDARQDLNEKTADGTIKAGDIIVYLSWGASEGGSYGREHVSIITDGLFTGTTDNYTGYGEERWPSDLIGEATVANSLNYSYGTEFDTPANAFFEVGQASGYVVYRIVYEEEEPFEIPYHDGRIAGAEKCIDTTPAPAEIIDERSALQKVTDELVNAK